ncbi:MAG: hypothetical protein WC011_01375 [Candidatus Paceibacterota bacterium]
MEILIILGLIIGIALVLFINFTTVESGNYKFIVIGETYSKTLDPYTSFSFFGWYWIGISFLYKVHNFPINKYKVNPDRKPDEAKSWVVHEDGVIVDTLRKVVTLPILMEDVELKDRTKINLLLNVILEYRNPYIFVFDLKGNPRPIISIIASKITNEVNKVANLTAFIDLDTSESADFFKGLLDENPANDDNLSDFNTLLLNKTGSIANSFNISEFNADRAILDAANKKAIAVLNAEALGIDAEANANYKRQDAVAEIDSLIERLEKTGANPSEILKAVSDLKRSQAIEKTKTTTLVLGGSTGTNIST